MKGLTLAFCLLALTAASEPRTWTFIEDGVMQCPTGGRWSFKKGGRVDAAFIGLKGTNVFVMAEDGTRRFFPVTSLSEKDRAYLKTASGMSELQAADVQRRATAQSVASMRKGDAAQMRTDAATKRRVAQLQLEEAARVENEAARLANRASSLEAQADSRARFADRVESSAVVPPKTSFAAVNARGTATVKAVAADGLEDDSARLGREAAEKRAYADDLLREASRLEDLARSIESGARPRNPESP
jgi:hypothetical protein